MQCNAMQCGAVVICAVDVCRGVVVRCWSFVVVEAHRATTQSDRVWVGGRWTGRGRRSIFAKTRRPSANELHKIIVQYCISNC